LQGKVFTLSPFFKVSNTEVNCSTFISKKVLNENEEEETTPFFGYATYTIRWWSILGPKISVSFKKITLLRANFKTYSVAISL